MLIRRRKVFPVRIFTKDILLRRRSIILISRDRGGLNFKSEKIKILLKQTTTDPRPAMSFNRCARRESTRQTSLKRSSLKRSPAATERRRLDEDCPWQKHVVTLRSDLWRTEVKIGLPVGPLNQKATNHPPRREELATHHHAGVLAREQPTR